MAYSQGILTFVNIMKYILVHWTRYMRERTLDSLLLSSYVYYHFHIKYWFIIKKFVTAEKKLLSKYHTQYTVIAAKLRKKLNK